MKIRTKVVLSSLSFLAASGGVGYWCFLNIQREEGAFEQSRRALNAHAAVTDIEYFLTRQGRALENYVLLGDEAEKLQLSQARGQAQRRVQDRRKAAAAGDAYAEQIAAVEAALQTLAGPSQKIETLLEANKRVEAMGLVEKEFAPAAAKALADFRAVKQKTGDAKDAAERRMLMELRRNHLSLLGGLGLITLFGLMFLLALYRAVIGPVHRMRGWADRVAQGDKSATLGFVGANELTELARSIGEMAIQLTRPKAAPREVPPAPVAAPPPRVEELPEPEPAIEIEIETAPAPRSSIPLAGKKPAAPPVERPKTPARPKTKDSFEEAADEFRDILSQMAGRPAPKGRPLG